MRALLPLPFLLLLSGPALAQATPDICTAALDDGSIIYAGYEAQAEKIPAGCKFTNVYIDVGPFTRFAFESLTIIAPDLGAALEERRQPAEAIITADGLRVVPNHGDPLLSYITENQMAPYDVSLNYRWDEETGDTEISRFLLSAEPVGSLMVTARLRDVPSLNDPDPNALPKHALLETLNISVEDYGFFRAVVAPIIVGYLPSDQDPVPLIEIAKADTAIALGEWPPTSADDDSKNALAAMALAFPDLRGSYEIAFASETGLSLTSFVPLTTLTEIVALLGNHYINASFTPAAENAR